MKILELLSISKEEKDKKNATRIAKALKRGQEALIDSLEEKKDDALGVIESLVHGNINKINIKTFNEDYQLATKNIALHEIEIKIAKATLRELFTDEE